MEGVRRGEEREERSFSDSGNDWKFSSSSVRGFVLTLGELCVFGQLSQLLLLLLFLFSSELGRSKEPTELAAVPHRLQGRIWILLFEKQQIRT